MESGEGRPVEALGWDLLWRVEKGPEGGDGRKAQGDSTQGDSTQKRKT